MSLAWLSRSLAPVGASYIHCALLHFQTGREEQKKQRELDLERLLQRYRNVKNELEAQQNLERIRMERMAQGAA